MPHRRTFVRYTAPLDEAAVAWPPRYWWAKRLAVVGVTLAVSVVAGWVWWDRDARRKLDGDLAAARARGELTTVEDFATAAPSGDAIGDIEGAGGNSAKAMGFLDGNEWELVMDAPLEAGGVKLAERVMTGGGDQAIELLTRARGAGHVPRGVDLRARLGDPSPGNWDVYRELANVTKVAGNLAHHRGDDAVAVERVRDALFVARALESRPGMAETLLATGIDAMAADWAGDLASSLAVERGSGRPATRDQVVSLINDLTDDAGHARRRVRALQAERAIEVERLSTGPYPRLVADRTRPTAFDVEAPWRWQRGLYASRPWRYDAARRAVAVTNWAIASMDAPWVVVGPSWSSMVASGRSGVREVPLQPASLLAEDASRDQSPLTVVKVWRRTDMLRHLAAVELAIRLYELDHGRRPASLGELVPAYLRELPSDPFASKGTTIGYVSLATTRPFVYSVFEDGQDQVKLTRVLFPHREYRSLDFVSYLDPPAKAPPASNPAAPY